VTKRFPATELVHDLCERAKVDVVRCEQLWPIVQEHSRRGGAHFPISTPKPPNDDELVRRAGAGIGATHGQGDFSDPTADAALAAMERPIEPEVVMRRVLLQFLDVLYRLDMVRKGMEKQVPAMAAALTQGREPTDGRTMAEVVALREHSRAVRGDIVCLACQHPAGRVLAGFDEACYKAWTRAGRPDRGQWIPQRRAFLEGQDEERSEVVALRGRWDPSVHSSIGPADGLDRRAA